jgi:hypothetical protein
MPVAEPAAIEASIIKFVQDVSGQKSVHCDQMIGRDVGVYGADGVLLLELIEEKFDLDLSPFVEARTKFLPATWWDRIRGRTHGRPVADAKVKDLIEYVMQHKGTGRKLLPRYL